MKILEAIRRMLTLPKKFNSIEDIKNNSAEAVEKAIENLESVIFILRVLNINTNMLITMKKHLEKVRDEMK